jgi:hypothetical protein
MRMTAASRAVVGKPPASRTSPTEDVNIAVQRSLDIRAQRTRVDWARLQMVHEIVAACANGFKKVVRKGGPGLRRFRECFGWANINGRKWPLFNGRWRQITRWAAAEP